MHRSCVWQAYVGCNCEQCKDGIYFSSKSGKQSQKDTDRSFLLVPLFNKIKNWKAWIDLQTSSAIMRTLVVFVNVFLFIAATTAAADEPCSSCVGGTTGDCRVARWEKKRGKIIYIINQNKQSYYIYYKTKALLCASHEVCMHLPRACVQCTAEKCLPSHRTLWAKNKRLAKGVLNAIVVLYNTQTSAWPHFLIIASLNYPCSPAL